MRTYDVPRRQSKVFPQNVTQIELEVRVYCFLKSRWESMFLLGRDATNFPMNLF